MARRYEFYFLVAKQYFTNERSEWVKYCFCHEKIKFISSSRRVMFFLLYRHADDGVFDDFPKISDHLPKISEDFPKLFRRPDERSRTFSKNFRKFPKMSEDFRRLPKTFKEATSFPGSSLYFEVKRGPWERGCDKESNKWNVSTLCTVLHAFLTSNSSPHLLSQRDELPFCKSLDNLRSVFGEIKASSYFVACITEEQTQSQSWHLRHLAENWQNVL